jgi:hypothetical protein
MNEEQKHYFRCGQAFAKAARIVYEIDEVICEKSHVSNTDLDHWKSCALDIMIFLDDEYE